MMIFSIGRRVPSSKYLAARKFSLLEKSFLFREKGESILSCVESCPGLKSGHMRNGHVYKIQVTSDLFILLLFDRSYFLGYICRKMCDKRISRSGSLSKKLTACSFEMTRYSVVQIYGPCHVKRARTTYLSIFSFKLFCPLHSPNNMMEVIKVQK